MIQVGSIYVLWCDFTNPPKEKFCVCVQAAPRPLFLLINSHINQFTASQHDLVAQQVPILSRDYPFLDHDSWINCSEVCPVDSAARQLPDQQWRSKGPMEVETRHLVIDTVQRSRTLPPRMKKLIVGALTA